MVQSPLHAHIVSLASGLLIPQSPASHRKRSRMTATVTMCSLTYDGICPSSKQFGVRLQCRSSAI